MECLTTVIDNIPESIIIEIYNKKKSLLALYMEHQAQMLKHLLL